MLNAFLARLVAHQAEYWRRGQGASVLDRGHHSHAVGVGMDRHRLLPFPTSGPTSGVTPSPFPIRPELMDLISRSPSAIMDQMPRPGDLMPGIGRRGRRIRARHRARLISRMRAGAGPVRLPSRIRPGTDIVPARRDGDRPGAPGSRPNYRYHAPMHLEFLRMVACLFDQNGDGKLSLQEARLAARIIPNRDIKAFFHNIVEALRTKDRHLDRNGDGQIDLIPKVYPYSELGAAALLDPTDPSKGFRPSGDLKEEDRPYMYGE